MPVAPATVLEPVIAPVTANVLLMVAAPVTAKVPATVTLLSASVPVVSEMPLVVIPVEPLIVTAIVLTLHNIHEAAIWF